MRILVSLALVFMIGSPLIAQGIKEGGGKYPAGQSNFKMSGLEVTLLVPRGLSASKPGSLVILLHGMGGKGKVLMTVLQSWVNFDFVICAPQATGKSWSTGDLANVEKIGVRLLKEIPIDSHRVHVMGFSNGGWNLPRLAFSDKLKPRSSVYVGAGFRGAAPPKWALKHHSVLAVAGEQDPNAAAARRTPSSLSGKVSAAESRFQPNLGHQWPRKLTPYMLWWISVQEGRFRYGQSLVFDWANNIEVAKEKIGGLRRGGILVYVYDSKKKEETKAAKNLEHHVFFDPAIRFYVDQIAAVEFDLALKPWPFKEMHQTPFVAMLNKSGKITKIMKGKIKKKSLRRALKTMVPTKKLPKGLK